MKQFLPNSSAMKRIFSVITIAAFMAGCNPSPNTTVAPATTSATTDTTGFTQFQAWKAQNELANPNSFNNNPNAQSVANIPARSNSVTYTPEHSTTHRSVSHSSHRSYSRSRSSSGNGGSYSSSSSNTARAKRGWSKAAKGAVIGGVTGGVAGAIINKRNRVAGGVIGGVLGAGVGYGLGRGMDKRDGRY
jgi:hypothetical protein